MDPRIDERYLTQAPYYETYPYFDQHAYELYPQYPQDLYQICDTNTEFVIQELLNSPEIQATGESPLLEVASIGMEPAFYIQIQKQTYDGDCQTLSTREPKHFSTIHDDPARAPRWFAGHYNGEIGNLQENYQPWPEPHPAELAAFKTTSCAVTLVMDSKGSKKLAMLHADPSDDESCAVWNYIGFSLEEEWRLDLGEGPRLHTSSGEPLYFNDMPRPADARWTCLFDDSNLFSRVKVGTTNYSRRLIGERAMLWALAAFYYTPDNNLEYSLSRMFNAWNIEYHNPNFFKRRTNPSSRSTNEVVVATIYWKADQKGEMDYIALS